jgi:hypothetical protein
MLREPERRRQIRLEQLIPCLVVVLPAIGMVNGAGIVHEPIKTPKGRQRSSNDLRRCIIRAHVGDKRDNAPMGWRVSRPAHCERPMPRLAPVTITTRLASRVGEACLSGSRSGCALIRDAEPEIHSQSIGPTDTETYDGSSAASERASSQSTSVISQTGQAESTSTPVSRITTISSTRTPCEPSRSCVSTATVMPSWSSTGCSSDTPRQISGVS